MASAQPEPHPRAELLKSQPWYHPTVRSIPPTFRRLLESRGIPPSEVESHTQSIRDRAWPIFPYPCIGSFHFATLPYLDHPLYQSHILDVLSSQPPDNETNLLDLGCALAQDFRLLQSSGVHPARLTGLDLHMGFIDLGYDLFGDKTTLSSTFVTGNMLDSSTIPASIHEKFNILWFGASTHLFSLPDQIKAYSMAIKTFLKPFPAQSTILGYSIARSPAQEKHGMFWHDPASFVSMWQDISVHTQTRWRVRTWLDRVGTSELISGEKDENIWRMHFALERLELGQVGPGTETGQDDAGTKFRDEKM